MANSNRNYSERNYTLKLTLREALLVQDALREKLAEVEKSLAAAQQDNIPDTREALLVQDAREKLDIADARKRYLDIEALLFRF
jgi:hypothetical protein